MAGTAQFMIVRVCAGLLVALLLSSVELSGAELTGADRRPAWVDPGWRRTVARCAVSFDEQGLSTETFDFEIKALNDKGAEAIAQQSFQYNSYFDDLSSAELVTLKAD